MYKSQAAVGTERVVGCTLKTCTKKGKKAVWVNSFAADDCCSYQRTGYQVEEYIGSQIAEDGCNNITISCARREGRPRIVFQAENTCITPVSEDMFSSVAGTMTDSLHNIMETLAVVANNTG